MNAGCAGETVRSLATCAMSALVHDEALYKSTFTLPFLTLHGIILACCPTNFAQSKMPFVQSKVRNCSSKVTNLKPPV